MKKFFLIFIVFVLSVPALYKQITHGFRLGKLDLRLTARDEWALPSISDKEKTEIQSLLKQPFTYIDKGKQSYVFQSQDGKMVIKLFKSGARFFNSAGKNPKESHSQRIEKTFRACLLAYASAREETGLVYLHLNPTSGQEPTLRIKDRLGRCYDLPLDRYSFAIQKKAEPFKPIFFQALKQGSSGALIDSYLRLIRCRAEKGICNSDIHLIKNFGFLNGKAIEIDFGNYVYLPDEKKEEFSRFAARMRAFLQKHSPESLAEYDRIVEAFR